MSACYIIALVLTLILTTCSSFQCTSDRDCEYLGSCINTTCECKPGWIGISCSTLNLGSAPYPNMGIWPLNESNINQTTYSWGFSPVYDTSDGLFHAIVNQGCYNISQSNQPMVDGSFLIHVTSEFAMGPFIYKGIIAQASTFNPHLIYNPLINKYLLFFRINELTAYPVCIGNGVEIIGNTDETIENMTANSMDVAIADEISGEWTVIPIIISNMPSIHISNPSVIILANGTYVLAFRFNTNAEHVGIAISHSSYIGPYVNIANLSIAGEDPFLWQDMNDHTFHIIFHVENAEAYSGWPSLHAYSKDLYHWDVSQSYERSKVGCYSTVVTWVDGQNTTFYRRERSQILFDSNNGDPLWFYSAVQEYKAENSTHFGYSYSVVQSVVKDENLL